MIIVETNPMIVPSTVLPLLTNGIIFLLPNKLPPKYAKISIVLTKITAYKNIYSPFGLFKIPIREKKERIIIFDMMKHIKFAFLYKRKILLKKTEIRRNIIKLLNSNEMASIL